jgi:hypothetical protein
MSHELKHEQYSEMLRQIITERNLWNMYGGKNKKHETTLNKINTDS